MDLQQFQKDVILKDIIRSCHSSKSSRDDDDDEDFVTEELFVLVLDDVTTKIVAQRCFVSDLTPLGVGVPVAITSTRESLPLPAIYFLSAEMASVELLVKDFANKKPRYSRAHVFFLGRVPDDVMDHMASCKRLLTLTRNVTEIYIDFMALQRRVFTFSRKNSMHRMYSPENQRLVDTEVEFTADRLSDFFVGLKELPYIRFHDSELCENFAQALEKNMRDKVRALKDLKTKPKPCTVLIYDRSFDPLSPLMHEFTFECMIHDLLKVRAGSFVQLPNATEVEISETDEIWKKLRHDHIANVIPEIERQKKVLMREQERIKELSKRGANLKDMSAAVRSIPEYKAKMSKFVVQHQLASNCTDEFQKHEIVNIADLEQIMETGVDDQGERVKIDTMQTMMGDILQDRKIRSDDKLRLLATYSITQRVDVASRMLDVAKLSDEQAFVLDNLELLGVERTSKPIQKVDKQRLKEKKREARSAKLKLCRYNVPLKEILESHIADDLSRDTFPYVMEPPPGHSVTSSSARGRRNRSPDKRRHRKSKLGVDNNDAPRSSTKRSARGKRRSRNVTSEEEYRPLVVVFVLGGVTFSEIRSVYEINEEHSHVDVIIGSSDTLNPREYTGGLAELDPAAFGS